MLVRRDGHVPPLAAAYDGPFLVLERSLRFFKLQVGDRVDTVSTLRLKPCTSPSDVPVAQPPRRGRPPAAAAEQYTVPCRMLFPGMIRSIFDDYKLLKKLFGCRVQVQEIGVSNPGPGMSVLHGMLY